jgi:hypothetical protein
MSKFESYKIEVISRKDIKFADYNPRTISDKAKGKIKDNIKNRGLVMPLVWNKRTGNLVAGHQRLTALDSLEKNKDYELTVSVIDVDDKTEKEQNIFLNNPEAQGQWDIDRLSAMYKDDKLDYANTGFDAGEMYQLFGKNPEDLEFDALEELTGKMDLAKEIRSKLEEMSDNRDDADFYAIFIFKTIDMRDETLKHMGLEPNMYQDGKYLMDAVNFTYSLIERKKHIKNEIEKEQMHKEDEEQVRQEMKKLNKENARASAKEKR